MLVLWWMRVRSLDLHEALGTNGLVATTSFVEVRRVVKETDWTLRRLAIEISFDWQARDVRVMW